MDAKRVQCCSAPDRYMIKRTQTDWKMSEGGIMTKPTFVVGHYCKRCSSHQYYDDPFELLDTRKFSKWDPVEGRSQDPNTGLFQSGAPA